MLTVGIVLCLVTALWVGCWVTAWLSCSHRASRAADLAALSGAAAELSSGRGCAVARGVSSRNGAELTGCRVESAGGQVVLEVSTRVALVPRVPGGPRWALGRSLAGKVFDVGTTGQGSVPGR